MTDQTYHYVVGDIHGCLTELVELEDKIAHHAAKRGAKAHLVSSGDLIDRGADSAGVVRHLRNGVIAGSHTVVFGNHEQMLFEILREFVPAVFADTGAAIAGRLRDFREVHASLKSSARYLGYEEYLDMRRLLWIAEGGGATLASYGIGPGRPETWSFPPEDLRFLASSPLLWEHEKALVTHALCEPEALAAIRAHQAGIGPEPSLNHIMSAVWCRKLPKTRLDLSKWHVSGHTAAKRVRLRPAIGCVQVDSGCVFGARLSAWCVEAEDVVFVKANGQ